MKKKGFFVELPPETICEIKRQATQLGLYPWRMIALKFPTKIVDDEELRWRKILYGTQFTQGTPVILRGAGKTGTSSKASYRRKPVVQLFSGGGTSKISK